jgi:Ni/Fe-hydrogenase subunit HybB-like protein
MAILVYIFNKGKYHALVRPAVLTSALGYSLAAVAIVIDVGRYWNIWKLPFAWRWWNLSSALLEVALCVMAYVIVLWIEMSPVFLEQWKEGKTGLLRNLAVALSPILDKALLWILALGLLLPTMHQSSLGSVMLLAHQKLHPLWHTPLLPLLFLVSCIAMGYGVVVLESTLSSRAFKRRDETPMLASLGGVTSALLLAYVAIRLVDLALRGRVGLIFASGWLSFFFLLEMALFLVPAVMLLSPRWCTNAGNLFRAGMLVVLAGSLYRFTTYLIAFNPGPGWSYFPAVPEMLVTFGIVAFEIMVYIVLVKRFPILAGAPQGAAAR